MESDPAGLRAHARRCRSMAQGSLDKRLAAELEAMAQNYDKQAIAAENRRRTEPDPDVPNAQA